MELNFNWYFLKLWFWTNIPQPPKMMKGCGLTPQLADNPTTNTVNINHIKYWTQTLVRLKSNGFLQFYFTEDKAMIVEELFQCQSWRELM